MLGSLRNAPKITSFYQIYALLCFLNISSSSLLHELCTTWPLFQNMVSQDFCMTGSFSLNFQLNNHLNNNTFPDDKYPSFSGSLNHYLFCFVLFFREFTSLENYIYWFFLCSFFNITCWKLDSGRTDTLSFFTKLSSPSKKKHK